MKRLLNFIFVFVVGLFVVMPFAVKAGQIVPTSSKDCDEPDAEGYCYTSVVLDLKNNTSAVNNLEVKMTFNSSEVIFVKFTGQNGWENVGDTAITNKVINFKFANLNGDFTGSSSTIGTVVIKHKGDVDCSADIEFENQTTTTTTTETTTTTTDTVTNPSTGVSLPVAILAGGIVVAGVVYYVSKRNTKMYKI